MLKNPLACKVNKVMSVATPRENMINKQPFTLDNAVDLYSMGTVP
jgi:hypothetical protein